MPRPVRFPLKMSVLILCAAGLSGSTNGVDAQAINGQARAVQVTTVGLLGPVTTAIADTGTLNSASDARNASGTSGAVASLLTTGVVHAASIGMTDRVSSEASVADLTISAGGLTIGAGFVMSRAQAAADAPGSALVDIKELEIDGVPVAVSGEPNQTLLLPGGRLVINQQQTSTAQSTVAALHLVIDGVADVIVASATANAR